MIVTEPLEQILTEPGARELSLDDRRLDEVLSHADHNRFIQAAEGAQRLWFDRFYDVRTLGCYLFGVFLERGVSALPLIFHCIERALKDNFPYLGPSHKKERHLDTALRWLFDGIVNQTRHHERQKDAVWTKWNADWIRPIQQNALESGQRVVRCVEEVLPGLRSRQSLFHLLALIETMATASEDRPDWDLSRASVIPAPPPPPDESSPPSGDSSGGYDDSTDSDDSYHGDDRSDSESSDDGDDSDDSNASSDSDESNESEDSEAENEEEEDGPGDEEKKGEGEGDGGNSAATGDSDEQKEGADDAESDPSDASDAEDTEKKQPAAPALQGATLTIPVNPALASLLDAVGGFVSLTAKGRIERAAILAQHIQHQLDSVDITELLPSLFVDYLLALVKHSEKLKSHLGKESDVATETLRKLCRADLKRFLSESER